jgi:hypothetical protein
MKRRLMLVVFLLTIGFIHKSNGYGRGAPDTTCSSMMPLVSCRYYLYLFFFSFFWFNDVIPFSMQHGPNAQTSPSPFTTTPLQVNTPNLVADF